MEWLYRFGYAPCQGGCGKNTWHLPNLADDAGGCVLWDSTLMPNQFRLAICCDCELSLRLYMADRLFPSFQGQVLDNIIAFTSIALKSHKRVVKEHMLQHVLTTGRRPWAAARFDKVRLTNAPAYGHITLLEVICQFV